MNIEDKQQMEADIEAREQEIDYKREEVNNDFDNLKDILGNFEIDNWNSLEVTKWELEDFIAELTHFENKIWEAREEAEALLSDLEEIEELEEELEETINFKNEGANNA